MTKQIRTKEFSNAQQLRMNLFLRQHGCCVIEDVRNDRYVSYHGRFMVATGDGFDGNTKFHNIKELVYAAVERDWFVDEFEKLSKLSKLQRYVLGLFNIHLTYSHD